MKILLDENLSPQIAVFLRGLGHDVKLVRVECKGASDEVVVGLALRENRTLLTLDKDMGFIYYFSYRGKLRVIVLRPLIQSIESVIGLLKRFLDRVDRESQTGVFVLTERGYRLFR